MAQPLIEVSDLSIDFILKRNPLGRATSVLRAVDHLSLDIAHNETVGLVGESGSGKSTVGRGLLRLVNIASGSVRVDGKNIADASGRELRDARRNLQMIFQDPYSSLDPSMTIEEIVGEPLRVHETGLSRSDRRDRIIAALKNVDLQEFHLQRYPFEFSGGQRQRVAIARAVILNPSFIVCDEAVSALDVSTQSRVINLLSDLQTRMGLAYLFIAHDLDVVRAISDRIAVMYLSRLVESGPSERVYNQPAHPYTEALLSAIPHPHPTKERERIRIRLAGEMPSAINPPSGCRFHTRCPYVMEICRSVAPTPTEVLGGGQVECHLHTEGPRLAGQSILGYKPTSMVT